MCFQHYLQHQSIITVSNIMETMNSTYKISLGSKYIKTSGPRSIRMFDHFLDASPHVYKWFCPSVGPPVGRRSVYNVFVKLWKWCELFCLEMQIHDEQCPSVHPFVSNAFVKWLNPFKCVCCTCVYVCAHASRLCMRSCVCAHVFVKLVS